MTTTNPIASTTATTTQQGSQQSARTRRLLRRCQQWLGACALPLLVAAPAAASSVDGVPLTVVYWSAKDCRWCTWWEGTVIGSGGEAKFLKSAEGKAVRYTVVKKPSLSMPFRETDFKPEQKWLWPRVRDESDGKIKGYPSFSLYEGDKLVAYALGEEDIEGKLLPAIRERMKK